MIYLDVYAWIMFIRVQICLLSDFITSGNRELLFRSHNAIDLRRGQRERFRAGLSNMRSAGRMRPFASTPAACTKDTVIWSFNGQNCSFHNLNWINVRRSQKNSMLFFIQNVFYTWKYDRLFPSVKKISFFFFC